MFAGQNSNRVIPPDNALTIPSAMSHGLERLLAKHRFGSLRRSSKPKLRAAAIEAYFNDPDSAPASLPTSSAASTSVADEHSLFPQPSFLRPKAARMVARHEASPTGKPCSPLPTGLSQPPKAGDCSVRSFLGEFDQPPDAAAAAATTSPDIPHRGSSLRRGTSEPFSLDSLVHYEFTERESKDVQASFSSLCAVLHPASISPTPSRPIQADVEAAFDAAVGGHAADAARDDTPPPSDHDGSNTPSPLNASSEPLPLALASTSTSQSQPTPGPSPSLLPTPDLLGSTPRVSQDSSGRRPSLQSMLAPQTPAPELADSGVFKFCDPVLQEPALGDILGLSDDDIAESCQPYPDFTSEEAPVPRKPSLAGSHGRTAHVRPPTPQTPHGQDLHAPDGSPKFRAKAKLPPPSPSSIRRLSARLSVASNDDRAAAMAAFEVARIASRYELDLIYVINLWPNNAARQSPQSPFATDVLGACSRRGSVQTKRSSASSMISRHRRSSSIHFTGPAPAADRDAAPNSGSTDGQAPEASQISEGDEGVGLNYRFLAAYGLHTVKAPLQIAYGVHSKILQTEGWIEYRGTDPEDYERGYACSFYTGHAPACEDGATQPSVDELPGADLAALPLSEPAWPLGRLRSEHNRGIVFAAYRKPRTDGTVASVLSASERSDMQQDVQGLIDMIIDFHVVKRRHDQLKKLEMLSAKQGGVARHGSRRRGESFSACMGVAATACGSTASSHADGAPARASI